ncbi:membrane dipeptidase [Rhizorhabdus wittichii]|uniref:Membrane dipeptidase n=1 Tax=Rhizorhabdus wittichii TaxID=160791 RepID=A0A975D030_9SPHN|nr:membrane dipeptidase [Rhizorhabdus wittichii]QTH20198.1 membrane dipeptidase [Rhizorhabdus wittichii]
MSIGDVGGERFPAARALLARNLVWDNHGCMPLRTDMAFLPQLARYREAGVDVAMLNIGFDLASVEEHVRVLAAFRAWLLARPDDYVLVDGVGSIDRARRTGRLAVGFDIEGTNGFGDQPSMVGLYYDLGVRWAAIAYNRNNSVGGGCQDDDGGLTELGREIVAEMNCIGMMVCCSHTGVRTAFDVIRRSTAPVILSHSNPRALHDHPRNVPDELMVAIARSGGVIGINGVGLFLGDPKAGARAYADHIEYAMRLVGEDHVAIGMDHVFDRAELISWVKDHPELFPPEEGYDEGLKIAGPEILPGLVAELLNRGFGEDVIARILGGNLRRVAAVVWKKDRVA